MSTDKRVTEIPVKPGLNGLRASKASAEPVQEILDLVVYALRLHASDHKDLLTSQQEAY